MLCLKSVSEVLMEFRGLKTNGIQTPPGAFLHNITRPFTHLPSVFSTPPSSVCICTVLPPGGMALGVALLCVCVCLCLGVRLHGWVNSYWQHHLWPLTLFAVLINSAEHKQGFTFPAVLFIVATKATRILLQQLRLTLTPSSQKTEKKRKGKKKTAKPTLIHAPAFLKQTKRPQFTWHYCPWRQNKKLGVLSAVVTDTG